MSNAAEQISQAAEPKLSFTIFAPGDKKMGNPAHQTWSKLCAYLAAGSKADTKEQLRGWCPAVFRDNHRTIENVLGVSCLALDIDNKGKDGKMVPADEVSTIEATLKALDGHELFIYTSFSHTSEWPRFRVVVPLDTPITAAEYEHLWAACADWLLAKGITVDGQAKDPSRLWLVGPRGRVETWGKTGKPLDTASFIERHRAELKRMADLMGKREPKSLDVSERVLKYLGKCPVAKSGEGGHETTWNVIRAVVRGFDLDDDQALALLTEWNQRCEPPWSDKDLKHKIRQARKSGTTPAIGAFLVNDKKARKEKPLPSDVELARMSGASLEETAELVGIDVDTHEPTGITSVEVANLGDEAPPPPANDDSPSHSTLRNLTDLGNAERLVDRFGEDLRFVTSWGRWICWDGKRWVQDDKDGHMVRHLAHQVARSIYLEAAGTTDKDAKRQLLAWAKQSEGNARLTAMVKVAEDLPSVRIHHDVLDADSFTLNCSNGTLDLKSGHLRRHRRQDYCTKITRVAYDPSASLTFVEGVLASSLPDPDVRAYVLKLLGYSLTGSTSTHVLPVHYGRKGRNGKGTILGALVTLMGEYADEIPVELVTETGGSDHPTGLTLLHGKRFVLASETGKSQSLKVAAAKRLTGADKIQARKMHQDFWRFDPTHKIHMATNHKPRINADPDDPIWERVSLIEWRHIPKDERIEGLKERFESGSDAEALFAMVVSGCLAAQKPGGLAQPEKVRLATEDYQDESDSLGDFIDERLVLASDPKVRVQVGHLYGEYLKWAESQGLTKPMTKRGLQSALNEREIGVAGRDSASNQAVRIGVRIRTLADDPGHREREAREAAAFGEMIGAIVVDSPAEPEDWLAPGAYQAVKH